ncbi:MAG: cellulase family glycosylhydrolase [Elusimicrobia bacterium]|nr:cellulase family glycosylhydrolase [Elusimicrobiota bacterium]
MQRIQSLAFFAAALCLPAAGETPAVNFDRGISVSDIVGQVRALQGPASVAAGVIRGAVPDQRLEVATFDVLSGQTSRGSAVLQSIAGTPDWAYGYSYRIDGGAWDVSAGKLKPARDGRSIDLMDASGAPLGAIRVAPGSAGETSYLILDAQGAETARSGPVRPSEREVILRDANGEPAARLFAVNGSWTLETRDAGALDPRVAVVLAFLRSSEAPPPLPREQTERAAATAGPSLSPGPARAGRRAAPPVSRAMLGDPLSRPSVQDGVLRDALGRQLLLRGINLSERSKRPPFAGWLKPEHVDAIARMGFDHVRFLLTWEAVEPKDGLFDEAYLDRVREELSWFEARGIYVVLDMHQDQFSRRFGGDGMPDWVHLPDKFPWFPNVIAPFPFNYINPKVIANFASFFHAKEKRRRLAGAWAHVVSRLKDSKAVIGYDLLNEPFPGVGLPWRFEARELSTLYKEITEAIREQDKDRVIFLEPQALAAVFPFTGLKTPGPSRFPFAAIKPSDPNAVYAPHWYDPFVDIRAILGMKPNYDGNRDRTADAFDNLRRQAQSLGLPLWLGEYGMERDRSGSDQYVRDHADLMDEKLISSALWELNPVEKDGFTFIDPEGKDYPLAAHIARPHPRAVAGTLERFRYDPAERALEVEWSEGKLGPGTPTVIELPDKVYAVDEELDVALSDPAQRWRVQRDPVSGRLLVWADPDSPRHKLIVKPRRR